MIKIVLTIPGSALRAGLAAILEAGSRFQLVGSSSVPGSLDQADVWIVTEAMSLSDMRQEVSASKSRLAILVLGEGESLYQDLGGLPVRAWGILPVDATVDELYAAVQAVYAGLIVIYPDLATISRTRQLSGAFPDVEPLVEPLTERETEVLQLVAQGLSNKQIAGRLYISEHTVKFHVSSIFGKLGATNRAEAVRLGVQQGLVAL